MSISYGGSNITFPDGSTQNTSPQTGFVNRLINGSAIVDQRNAGAEVTNVAGYVYSVDRWNTYGSQASKFKSQQVASPMSGFAKAIKFTSLSAYTVGASEFFFTNQWIEGLNVSDLGWGAAGASAATLSFKVYSSLTGTFGGVIRNDAGNRTYPFTFTVNAANTEETKTITIPGDTSGTWLTTNGKGIGVFFGLGVGSTYSGTAGAWGSADVYSATGATSVVGTSGATFYITGVSLVKGSTALPWEFRSYGQELALAQRYYEVGGFFHVGYTLTGNNMGSTVKYAVTKRAAPTFTQTNTSAGNTSATPQNASTGNNLESILSFRSVIGTNPAQFSETWAASSEL